MSLRIRLNIIITTLLVILFLYSSFYTISNARRSVHSEIESSTQLALQLIQAATTYSAPSNPDNITHMNFLRKLSELKRIRHLHIEIRSPTDILIPSENNLSEIKKPIAPNKAIKKPIAAALPIALLIG